MIDTIIFDIGNVLVRFRWKEYINELGFDQETNQKLAEATVGSRWWREIDLGASKDTYEAGMKADHPELEKELELFFSRTERIVEPFEYSKHLVKQLKEQGYRVYLLSNYGDFLYNQAAPQFTFRNYVDGELISYQIKAIKPDRKIYETLIEKFQIQPEHAIFIDDMKENIDGAKQVGLHGIVFQDYEQMCEALKEYAISVELSSSMGSEDEA